jgi:hypothetical protein
MDVAVGAPDGAFHVFLDRLMGAESGGRSHAKNPLSSALGPFQFINSTFLAVMRQHFPEEIASKSERQILAMRTQHDVARRAAHAFTKDNMAFLVDRGITPTFGHLRLAFLLGPHGAARVLQAPPSKPLVHVLEGGVISANPFMRRMTVEGLVARAARDVSPKGHKPQMQPDTAPEASRPIVADNAPAAAPVPSQLAAEQKEPSRVAEAGPAAQPEQAAPAPAAQAPVVAPVPAPVLADAAPAAEPRAVAEADIAVQPDAAEAPDAAAAAKPETKSRQVRATVAAVHLGSVRRGDRVSVIDVKCDSRLASCQRWIDQQVAKLVANGREG